MQNGTVPARTREEWLEAGAAVLAGRIKAKAGLDVAPWRLSFGFPKGHRGRGRAVGQCWSTELAKDGRAHIFVCPTQEDPARILDILLHELIHAATPGERHRGAFITAAKACGLVKPWTATTPSDELAQTLRELATTLGPLPHGALVPLERVKVGSRLRLYECDCGIKVRVAADDFEATCNLCDSAFERV